MTIIQIAEVIEIRDIISNYYKLNEKVSNIMVISEISKMVTMTEVSNKQNDTKL